MFGPKYKHLLCGDTIQSKSVHDFVTCSCGGFSIDGGGSYTRLVGDLDNIEQVEPAETFEQARKRFKWGVLRPTGYVYVSLDTLSNSHIENIIKDGYRQPLMQKELEYRQKHSMVVEDGEY